jgi:hypothetical protein
VVQRQIEVKGERQGQIQNQNTEIGEEILLGYYCCFAFVFSHHLAVLHHCTV